jgi:hypothetical protein
MTLAVGDPAPAFRLPTTEGGTASLVDGGDGGVCGVDASDDRYIYGEYIFLQLFRSSDRGRTTEDIYDGLLDAERGDANFIAPFALDPGDQRRLYAGGVSLWRTDDARAASPAWRRVRAPGSERISAVAIDPRDSNVVVVGQNDGMLSRTANGLAGSPRWTAIDDNAAADPLPNRFVTRVVFDPSEPGTVYACFGGFTDANFWRSRDAGRTWSNATGGGATGLPFAPVLDVAVDPESSDRLFAATAVGVFESPDGGLTWSATTLGPAAVAAPSR